MYDFVEQPVTIRNSEFPMLRKEPSHVFMQYGLQPTFFLRSDVEGKKDLSLSLRLTSKEEREKPEFCPHREEAAQSDAAAP